MLINMRGWVVLFGLCYAIGASAEVFRWVDEHGRVHFGDQPPAGAAAEDVELKINTYESPALSPDATASREVILYSAVWCAVCRKAKAYFTRRGIPFTEYDIETSERGRSDYLRLGARGVPVILVGDRRMDGFSAARFEKLYRSD